MKKGFTLIELLIVVSIIGLIVSMAIPGYRRARRVSQARACQANLTNIEWAKNQWALENNFSDGDYINWDDLLSPPDGIRDPYLNPLPACPADGEYLLNVIGTIPQCSSEEVGHNMPSIPLPLLEWTIEKIEPEEDIESQ